MTTWLYIGCKTTGLSKDILKNPNKLSSGQIKQIIESVPIIEGRLEAITVDAVVNLLLADNIFPLKIHPLNNNESKVEKLRKLRDKILKDIS